jgi:hypothetical protein
MIIQDVPPYMDYKSRHRYLESHWGFKCSCALCKSPRKRRRESDKRLHRMQAIIEELNNKAPARKPDPALAEELITLHEMEGLWGPIADVQTLAAQQYEMMGNMEKAREWAAIAKESLKIWKGVDHEYHGFMLRILGEEAPKESDNR